MSICTRFSCRDAWKFDFVDVAAFRATA